MADNTFHLTVEALRSSTIRYVVMTICGLVLMWFVRKWFFVPQCGIDDKSKPPLSITGK